MKKYKIAYLDEFDEDIRAFQGYASDEFEIITMVPVTDIHEQVETIIHSKVDALVVDFDLTDKVDNVHYYGVEIVEEIQKQREGFPVFILTSYDERAISEGDDVNIIYEKKVMFDPEFDKEIKFKERIKRQIEKYYRKLEIKENRLLELQDFKKQRSLTYYEENELLELDSFIEKSLNKSNLIPEELKSTSNEEKLTNLLTKVDLLLNKIKKNE